MIQSAMSIAPALRRAIVRPTGLRSRRAGNCLGWTLIWALAWLTPLQSAQADELASRRAACDAPGFAQVLQAELQPLAFARGIWLDAQRLQWPGLPLNAPARPAAPSAPRFVLAGSLVGALQTQAGLPLSGDDSRWPLQMDDSPLPAELAQRFKHLAPGPRLRMAPAEAGVPAWNPAHTRPATMQWALVQLDDAGKVLQATGLQWAGALDDIWAADAAQATPLGVQVQRLARGPATTAWRLWAPTAQAVHLCLHARADTPVAELLTLQPAPGTGFWTGTLAGDRSGQYYSYLVDVWVPGTGLVRQRVTDPYAISLSANSRRAWVGSLDAADTQPTGWARAPRPRPLAANTEMSIYELHVRDFSLQDDRVPKTQRGKYAAFGALKSHGMQHLRALARAGLSDVHLLPVFDLATVPEQGCTTPHVPVAPADSGAQQTAVMAQAASDCFNWGYDPLHFNAPEGSYASDANDGATRIREFRQMVMSLHGLGLRVGMDVVYNHLSASGQQVHSVLDRIVPGYYHRLNADGQVERSTCCDNSATEHRMMARLMRDSVRLWARFYRIDSFRFDLMGHQPRAEMLRLNALLRQDNGRDIQLIGEGWNFGEVANGARFVQASQGELGGSGIATFSDRARDALRGGGVGDSPEAMVARQGFLNGLAYAPNDASRAWPSGAAADATASVKVQLLQAADLVRLGLAGTLRSYAFVQADGQRRSGALMRYGDQSAGYVQQPTEVVNYVENHDNHTLWDLNAFKLPLDTSAIERTRVQMLGLAFTAWSQGVPYFHAGVDLLRSKSMDGNSYDSGDWFNRLDFSARSNHFGSGLPPERDNAALYPQIAARLALPQMKPSPAQIRQARQALRDVLAIRASSMAFRLRDAAQVQQRLVMHNTGPEQNPVLVAAELDARGLPGGGFARLLLLFNVHPDQQTLLLPGLRGQRWALHPVHLRAGAADSRPINHARFEPGSGRFTLPGRTAMVFVQR